MGVEQGGLTPEEAAKYKAKGREQLVTDSLPDYGRFENTAAVQAKAERDNAHVDALEKAKQGDLSDLSRHEQADMVGIARREGTEAAAKAAGKAQDMEKNGMYYNDVAEVADLVTGNEFGPMGSDKKSQANKEVLEGMNEVGKESNEIHQADRRAQVADSEKKSE